MPLHPEAQHYLDHRAANGYRAVNELTPAEAREQATRFARMTKGADVAQVYDQEIPGPYGPITLRVYHPQPGTTLPVVVFFHGGGWVTGSLDTVDAGCRGMANGVPCVLVSVNYHHAPEYKYPAAAEDAYAATKWVSEHAAELGGDPKRLAIAGTSAGGNLVAVVSLMARDRGGPSIVFQLMMVPITDYNYNTTSYSANAEGYGLTRTAMKFYWGHYLKSDADAEEIYCAPLRATDLSNLPPALVQTAEFDPLRDEGIAYAEALRKAGIPVELHTYAGMIHPYLGTEAIADQDKALRRALQSE